MFGTVAPCRRACLPLQRSRRALSSFRGCDHPLSLRFSPLSGMDATAPRLAQRLRLFAGATPLPCAPCPLSPPPCPPPLRAPKDALPGGGKTNLLKFFGLNFLNFSKISANLDFVFVRKNYVKMAFQRFFSDSSPMLVRCLPICIFVDVNLSRFTF